MSYKYSEERHRVFKEDVVPELLKLLKYCRQHVDEVHTLEDWYRDSEAFVSSSWTMLAVFDYLVQLGHLIEVNVGPCAGQHRQFRAV